MAGGGTKEARFNDSIITGFPNFSYDIFFVIFLKLSVKSVISCRCVCKSWRRSLCDQHFIKMHVNYTDRHHQSHDKLLLKSSSNSFYSVDLEESHGNAVLRNSPFKSTSLVTVLCSCNGMLCLATRNTNLPGRYMRLCRLVLWNPSTGDYKKLPSAEPPVDDAQTIGFGYDSSLEDYKMVRIITSDSEYRVDMYSLKANSWKVIGDLLDYKFFGNGPESGVYSNGFIYLMGRRSIICFDLKTEKLREVAWHHDINRLYTRFLSVIGGYLGLCQLGAEGEVVVWELKEDHDNKAEWIKLTTIPSKKCPRTFRRGINYECLQPLCLLQNGKLLLCQRKYLHEKTSLGVAYLKVLEYMRSEVNFVVYDPKRSSTLEAFPVQGISDDSWMRVTTYKESLVSPNFA